VGLPLIGTPPAQPSLPREREPIDELSNPQFGSVFQVGVPCPNNSVSPLSLRERVRVRGF